MIAAQAVRASGSAGRIACPSARAAQGLCDRECFGVTVRDEFRMAGRAIELRSRELRGPRP